MWFNPEAVNSREEKFSTVSGFLTSSNKASLTDASVGSTSFKNSNSFGLSSALSVGWKCPVSMLPLSSIRLPSFPKLIYVGLSCFKVVEGCNDLRNVCKTYDRALTYSLSLILGFDCQSDRAHANNLETLCQLEVRSVPLSIYQKAQDKTATGLCFQSLLQASNTFLRSGNHSRSRRDLQAPMSSVSSISSA